MTEEVSTSSEMGTFQKIIGIFTAPRQAFEAIDQQPTWFLPFIIAVCFFLVFQFMTVDIQMADRVAYMESQGEYSAEQLEQIKTTMGGPVKYIGFVLGPIVWLIMNAIIAGIFLVAGNMMIGGESSFKKVFAIINWSGLIGIVGLIIMTFLVISKGTTNGVGLNLSIFLDTPPIGEEKSLPYLILSKFDVFTIWGIILWIIGLSVSYKSTVQKATVPIISLWILWIIISVAFSDFFASLGM